MGKLATLLVGVMVTMMAIVVRSSATPAEDCASAVQDLAILRRLIRDSPPAAMLQLGVRIDDFERIAQSLHARWLATQSMPPPASEPTVAEQLTAGWQNRWWCFRNGDDSFGDCSDTKPDCDHWRTKLLTDHNHQPCPPLLTQQQCIDAQANAVGFTACERQPHAACFVKHFKLDGNDQLTCAPTIKICRARRVDVMRNYADDQIVKSDCSARE